MKILILTDDFPPQSFGGAGFSTFYLARGLQKAKHQVFVITTCQEKSAQGKSEYQGLIVFRIFTRYHERWKAYLSLYNPQTVGKVKKLIKEINPDVIHAHNIHAYLSYYCLKIAKESGKPVFFTARDAMPFSFGKLATKKYLQEFDAGLSWQDHLKQAKKRYNPLRNFLIKKYFKNTDKIFAVSHALKKALNQNGIDNVEVSYTGIDAADWQINLELVEGFKEKHGLQNKKKVFFGGRISGQKGLEQLNQAMTKVKKEIPEAILLVAGKGGLPAGSQGVGWLSGDDLKAAYWASDVVAVPSIYLDPFPRSNLEAMACQKPVIGTCYGGTPEIVQDKVTGFIVNPFNTDLMAERIVDLLKNQTKAEQFGQAGFARVKKSFSSEAHVNQTISWYQKIW